MERKTVKTIVFTALAGVSVLAVIVLSYYLLNAPDTVSSISLPDYTVIPTDQPEVPQREVLAEVNADNVAQVLASMTQLESFHAVMTLEYYWNDGSAAQTGEIWRRGGDYKLVLSDPAAGPLY